MEVYFGKANKKTMTYFLMVLGTHLRTFLFHTSRWEDALDFALQMIVWPPIRHMMNVCHGHFFIYIFPPLTSKRPEPHMMY